MSNENLAGFRCWVVDLGGPPDRPPDAVVVLCHGFGAPGDDLVPLAREVGRFIPDDRKVRFYFPVGPLGLDQFGLPGGRAWWQIDMERLLNATATRNLDELHRTLPDGLETLRPRFGELMDAIRQDSGCPAERFVIGGFSQGAMLATDYVLHCDAAPASLIIFSGALIAEDDWIRAAESCPKLDVLQSHGRDDTVLPFASAEALREMLKRSGHEVDFEPFDGGHTISGGGLQGFGQRIAAVAGSA
ncbi:alpha/beta hydrolase [Stratiformator vulcanicus]|uniref:Carboxylesterase 2 n=1 Tax=Stratiformator vulcanicus TaxID=2527980 RepID=A0A517QZZ2_9PLAN|nr:phospholipase [Stratiformator vulcanicus]QDT37217.1 Carboxylesterase 2 [Stratiformator vulcanicus]